jgi:uncharacterized protein
METKKDLEDTRVAIQPRSAACSARAGSPSGSGDALRVRVAAASSSMKSAGHARTLLLAISLALLGGAAAAQDLDRVLWPVPFTKVHLTDGFFAQRIEVNRRATIPACLEKCESTGRIQNFAIAGGLEPGKRTGLVFDDSDVYKVIEGIAYSLADKPDAALQARADAIIDKIALAQAKDGYIDTYITLVAPDKRWKDVRSSHELYCAGHLIEAAIAYERATGEKKLLEVAKRMAECIDREFGWKKHEEPTGHPELELALMKLYRRTNDRRWLDLARFFVDVRGNHAATESFGEYAQDHKPVREQPEVAGHAVRAMYLYTGMTDVAAATGDRTLLSPLEKIWHDVIDRKMYATGGIGTSASNEGFTEPFDLPNDLAYCETCAAIGMALWNQRMFLATHEAKYADVLEREIYNNVPAGVSIDGTKFFYVNPLSSDGDHHRKPWFDCSCCPSNLVRFLPAMGERMYAVGGLDVYVALYAAGRAEIDVGGHPLNISVETDYPWAETCNIRFETDADIAITLHLRVPGWCKQFHAAWQPNRSPDQLTQPEFLASQSRTDGVEKDGWWSATRAWRKGESISVRLPMPVERVHADARVEADRGRVALMRGPLVYCVEGVDNDGSARSLALPLERRVKTEPKSAELGGLVRLRASAVSARRFPDGQRGDAPAEFRAIPYCLWDNRAAGDMAVWIPEDSALADVPGEAGLVVQNGVRLSGSYCARRDTLRALNDERVPKSSSDDSIPRTTFWDHRGTKEWLAMEFAKTRSVHGMRVYWFDDTGHGDCRVPAAWRVSRRDGKEWKPVALKPASKYASAIDAWNGVEFDAVETDALRLDVELQPEFSAGVLEWEIE